MDRLYIIMYHYVRDLVNSRYPAIKGMDVTAFKKQIDFLCGSFNVVTMEQVLSACGSGPDLPDQSVLLTFDDGYIDNYTYVLPILEERGLQGSFFIPGKTFTTHTLLDVNKIHYILASSDPTVILNDLKKELDYYRGLEFDLPSWEDLYSEHAGSDRFDAPDVVFIKRILQTVLPERLRNMICNDLLKKHVGVSEKQLACELYMTEDQIHTMKRHGMFVGVHGYDHYWLGELPVSKMKEDVDKSLEILDEFIDHNCWVMNYPYGSYNQAVIDHIEERGCHLGLSADMGVAYIKNNNLFTLPRLDCNDFPPKSESYKDY